MEFYKMFYILHRRTDFYRLYRWERKTIMPEWYEEREKQAEIAYQRLMMPFNIMKNELMRRGYVLN